MSTQSSRIETYLCLLLLALGGAFLFHRAALTEHGMAKVYVERTELTPDPQHPDISIVREREVTPRTYHADRQANGDASTMSLSLPRTIGVWVAALLTLAIASFLYRDNPFYKLAEAIFIGVSAAYWMVVQFWSMIVPNLLGKLVPTLIQNWSSPGMTGPDVRTEYIYIIPALLGVLLLCRLLPGIGWISRWPLAFFIGVFAGLRLVQFIQADFLNQIRNGIVPLVVNIPGDPLAMIGQSLINIIMILGVLSCLVYFFFSFEHRGAIGRVARAGTWVLMITFGAMFGYTVMGRITLLGARLEFLYDNWLWLIDPSGARG